MMQKTRGAFNPLPIITFLLIFLSLLMIFGGCSTQALMPSGKQTVSGKGLTEQWDNYEKAAAFYESVMPYQTTLTQLRNQHADFENSQNIDKLGPTAVRNLFLENQTLKVNELPVGVQDCLNHYEDCRGYRIRKDVQHSEGAGSLFLRMLSFKREDIITGWMIELLFLANKDMFVYKEVLTGTPGGKAGSEMSKKPLGPAQEPLDHAGKFAPRPNF